MGALFMADDGMARAELAGEPWMELRRAGVLARDLGCVGAAKALNEAADALEGVCALRGERLAGGGWALGARNGSEEMGEMAEVAGACARARAQCLLACQGSPRFMQVARPSLGILAGSEEAAVAMGAMASKEAAVGRGQAVGNAGSRGGRL